MAVVSKLHNLVFLAKEKSSERRRALLREVTDLFFDDTPEAGTPISQEFDNVLISLAEQSAEEARLELSERFADAPLAPRGLILKLAQDAIEVAAPVLAKSSVLKEDDLLDIAETGSQKHLSAISQRETVSERLTDTIVRRGDDDTVSTLIKNEGARFSRQTMETVTERAETSTTLQSPLVERKDVPTDLLADLMLAVETHVRDRIMERFNEVDAAQLDAALAQSKARLAKRFADDREIAAAEKFVRTMAVRKSLDGNLLARLLREREMVKFYVAFAEMTGVDLIAARRAVEQDCVDPLALICRASNFDKALFVTLAVLRFADNEDAFKDARELGQLYDGVTMADAERAMRFWRMRRDVAA